MLNVNYNYADEIFNFIFVMSMRDAVGGGAYKGKKTWLLQSSNLESARKTLKAFADDVLEGKFISQEEYDARFMADALVITKDINKAAEQLGEEPSFTFGNVQLLINMTLKYFYLTSYKNESVKEQFRFCHCPMDNQLLRYVFKNKKQLSKDLRKKLGPAAEFRKNWYVDEFASGRYSVFQKAVRELTAGMGDEYHCICPIELDYVIWNQG